MIQSILAVAAWGQTAQIVGAVTDPSGAAVPGASITALNVNTNTKSMARSNADGLYTITLLPPGHYTVSISKAGFSPVTHSGLILGVGDHATIDAKLTVGALAQAVTVRSSAPLIDAQSATIHRVVSHETIVNLPLNGRDVTQLLTLQGGVIQTESSSGVVGNGFVVNGSRNTGVYMSLDGGMDINSYQNFTGELPNHDAIQEFGIQTNNFSAKYGNATGAVVSVVTKSGTNQFHGSAFEFVRNGALFDARNFFQASTDSLKRNQFGGTFGGPILKNRLFFFFSTQDTTIRSNPVLTHVFLPTAAERTGDFSAITKKIINPNTGEAFSGNQIPASLLSPVSLAFLKVLPSPSSADGGQYIGTPTIQDERGYTGKIDWYLGRHHISGKYFYNRFNQPFTGDLRDYSTMRSAAVAKSLQPYSQITFNDIYTISGSLLNSFTFSSRRDRDFNDWSSITLPLNYQQAGVQGIAMPDPPSVYLSVSGGFLSRPGWEYDLHESDLQWADNFTMVRGRHELEFGADFIRTSNSIKNEFRQQGMFTFNGSLSGNAMADFMLGDVYQFWQGGGEYKEFRQNRPGFFVQDNFRATSKLTLNLGLRWDPLFPPHDTLGRVECFVPGMQSTRFPNAPAGYLLAGDPGCPSGGMNTYLPELAPRFGFAYRFTPRTVIRGGGGLFWNPLSAIQYNTFVDSAPFSPQVTLYGVDFQTPYANAMNPFPQSFAPFVPPSTATFDLPLGQFGVFSSGWRPSYQESFNLTVEQQVSANTAVRASYIANLGRHLSYVVDTNYARYISGVSTVGNIQQRRPFQDFGEILNSGYDATASYNALQLSIQRRMASNLSFQASYTWSKSIDVGSAEAEPGQGTPLIPISLRANRGLSDFDIPNRFVMSYVWALPKLQQGNWLMKNVFGGWETSGILTLQSGTPFSILSGKDNSLSGDNIDYADVIGDPFLNTGRSDGQLISEYFNTAAFVQNASGTFGTSPRNLLRGPRFEDFDLALMKSFPVGERLRLQLRADSFNLLNRPNFGNPVANLNAGNFGAITSAGSPRILQFAVKVSF
ncbi:MAG TPA: carboxypeptidase regulatory-like domain-containing protein [Bryobacteraceae bacterium]